MASGTNEFLPSIKRRGVALPAETLGALAHMRVERATDLVGRATLRFRDAGYALSAGDAFPLGTDLVIAEPGAGILLEGTVTGVHLEQTSRTVPVLVVVADDAAYKLMRGTEVTTYLNGPYTEALRKICQRHGLKPEITASTLTMEYVLQAGTDLAFLDTVCQRLGYSWFVDDNATLVAQPLKIATPAVTLEFGTEVEEFSVRASGLRPTEVSVHGWDADQQNEVTDKNPAALASSPPAFVKSYTGSGPDKALSASSTAVADRRPLSSGEAKVLAGAYYDDWTSAAVVARGRTDVNSKIKPGTTVRISDAGPTSGDYLVTSVEHVYVPGDFDTRFVCGPRRPSGLVDTLGPRGADPGFTVSGLVIGVVTDANDPDKAGRVKVRYAGINGEVESPWARVVTSGAGNARGAVFHPEVKDEVLVGFENSDTRRPVVLGGLYSKRNTLPTGQQIVANGKVNYRRITSRRNHVIELADGDAATEQHVLLQLGTKAHKLRLGADRFDIEVGNGVPVSIVAGSAKFEITQAGDVVIQGKNVTIKADAQLSVEAGTKAGIKSNGATSLEGMQVQVKGSATTNVEASGPLALKGGVVQVN